MKRSLLILALLLAGVAGSGCSVRRLAVNGVTPALDQFVDALYAEPDPALARTAFETDLHLLQGLRRTHDKPRLAELEAMALTGYGLVFWEGQDNERAGALYLRARDVGLQLLGQDVFALDEETFQSWLAQRKPADLPALFWTAFPYGAWMNLNLDSQEALFTLPRVEAMVTRGLELDESYFFGAGHLFLGALACTRPRFVGGDPEAGLERFQAAARLTGPDFLLPKLFEARHYCPATLDEARFDEILTAARERRAELLRHPQALLNAWCLRQLDSLDAHREDLF
ncbi:MAG: TRAP transporter TatT component family protein [Candidatus Delongbacteria bacterium]